MCFCFVVGLGQEQDEEVEVDETLFQDLDDLELEDDWIKIK